MATILYNSCAVEYRKPSIMTVDISMVATAQTAKEAVEQISEDRKTVKEYTTALNSFRPDSYKQTSINIRKCTVREYFYVNKFTGQKISSDDYTRLPIAEHDNYQQKFINKFSHYESSLNITVELKSCETAATDFVNIFNMCVEKDFRCTYHHGVTNEDMIDINRVLFAKCIKTGLEDIKLIMAKANGVESYDSVKLLEIRDTDASAAPATLSAPMYGMSKSRSASFAGMDECIGNAYEPEQIILPELIEDLFNNNIEYHASVDLLAEV